jgi:AAA domain
MRQGKHRARFISPVSAHGLIYQWNPFSQHQNKTKMQLQKAARKKVKLRLSLASPTGFGKTAGALIIAHGMGYDWDKIAVIDTENESASLYADHTLPTGYRIGEFNTIALMPPYTPEKYTEAIKACEDAGMEVIIIDSVTHVWSGKGGLLESNSSLGSNTFQNWAKTTPRYQAWLSSILNSKCHIITTNRKKQGYSMTEVNGKKVVEKLGMEDQIRDGYDYEMTIAFEIINDGHLAKASKDRSSLFSDAPEFVITEEVGQKIKQWCDSGIDIKANAIAEMKSSTGLDQMKLCWTKYKAMQQDADFIAAKDEMKQKLTLVTA